MTSASFRNFVPPPNTHPRLGAVNFSEYDYNTWVEYGKQTSFLPKVLDKWKQLYEEPYHGVTATGEIEADLFKLRDEQAPTKAMFDTATVLMDRASATGVLKDLRYDLDAKEWRCWLNPEFYIAKHGVRFEEIPQTVTQAALDLVRESLSTSGFEDVLAAMRINRFLGETIGVAHIMNEQSYNFILFGEPSQEEPWGWSLWGHHLSLCVLVVGRQMVVSPVFRGCEPNTIDTGGFKGAEMFEGLMHLSTNMMQQLSKSERDRVIVYARLEHPDMPEGFPHPADGRNMAGAYQDNIAIPLLGIRVSELSTEAQGAVMRVAAKFLDFLPEGPLMSKINDIRQHIDSTWLSWMGGFGDEDVFHFRIFSPVVLCEFDHECGMYLTNKAPGRFHVHTVVRTPNGNDYGKALIKLWREKQGAIH